MLPFFYTTKYDSSQKEITLDEDTSRHIIQVLRMKKEEKINLTNGTGTLIAASIIDDHKKHCIVRVDETNYKEPPAKKLSIGISLIKNSSRFEWFLEKATEIGVSEIIPLICERTEKDKFRSDRMKGILTSAMIQSQQCWLPVLHEPIAYDLVLRQEEIMKARQRFIAHCHGEERKPISYYANSDTIHSVILIGPEGDFTTREVELAIGQNFIPVSLGNTRLRTETAGIVAAALFINK